jgi:regulatory protein
MATLCAWISGVFVRGSATIERLSGSEPPHRWPAGGLAVGFETPSIKGRALRYLAQREHSRDELERKLARHAQDTPEASAAEQIARALDELAAAGLQSEARVAQAVLRVQGARFGTHKLRHTLQAKGLAPALIAETLALGQGSELERAAAVWRRKFGTVAADAAERARQQRFLAGRGFSGDVIRRVVQGGDDEA